MTEGTVQAAGCVLWRRSPFDDAVEICLVHRPKYDGPYDHKQRSTKPQLRGGFSPEYRHA